MTKFIRNNQKKLMAFFGVFLMIAFVATTGTGRQGGAEQVIGTYDHGKSTLGSREVDNLSNEWRFLKRQVNAISMSTILGGGHSLSEEQLLDALTDSRQARFLAQYRDQFLGMQGQFGDLARAERTGEQIYAQIDNNDDMFALLVKDAQRQGVGVNTDFIESVLSARGITRDSDINLYESMKQSLRSLLMVSNAADRATSVVKITQPEIANLLASRAQQMSVNVLEFSASDFLDKVLAPTAKQLEEQFNKYKDKLVGGTGLTFGYKYPNRVSYDAIEVRREDAKKAVGPINAEDATLYYTQHMGDFHSSTMPSTRPADAFNLDTGPTTRQMTYEESKPKIIQTLTDQRTTELLEKVRDAIRDTMKADYQAYKVAIDSKAATAPVSSLGVPYNSKEYLSKLKDKIRMDFKVEVRTESEEALRTPKELTEPRQKKELFSSAERSIPFASYMTSLLRPFVKDLSEDVKKSLESARDERKPIDEWEPTTIFETPDHDAYLIARATKADPSHIPASMNEVKEKVTDDYKLAAASELAKKAAEAALAAAKTPKWLYTVAADEGGKAFTTGLFGSADNRMGAMMVPGYELKGEAVTAFKQGAEKLLTAPNRTGKAPKPPTTQATTQPTTQASTRPTTRAVAAATGPTSAPVITEFTGHPVSLIELPSEAKVVIAELDQLKPLWSKDQKTEYDTAIASQERTSTELVLRMQWFNYDHLMQRMDWTPAQKRQPKSSNQPPPNIPFGI